MALRQPVPILMYHKVGFNGSLPGDRRLNVPTRRFRLHIRMLSALGYTGITLSDCVDGWHGRRELPRKAVCITFDDGFRCVLCEAAPILRERHWPATVFVPSGYVGGTAAWPGIEGWSPEAVMDVRDLRSLHRDGWEIAGHTRTHANLAELDDEAALEEIAIGAQELSGATGARVRAFAYPYGKLNQRTPELVKKAGLECAVTVRSGIPHAGSDPFRLPRVKVASRDGRILFLYRLLLRGRFQRRGAG